MKIYRILKENETIEREDETIYSNKSDKCWYDWHEVGALKGSTVGYQKTANPNWNIEFRRRVYDSKRRTNRIPNQVQVVMNDAKRKRA